MVVDCWKEEEVEEEGGGEEEEEEEKEKVEKVVFSGTPLVEIDPKKEIRDSSCQQPLKNKKID